MAPYNPPVTHYAHLKVDMYSSDMIMEFIGARGCRFYNLTSKLNVRYIWFNDITKVIEVWGPYESFRDNDPINVIDRELSDFFKMKKFV